MRPGAYWCAAIAVALAAAVLPAQEDRLASAITELTADAPAVLPEQSRAGVLSRLERARTALSAGHVYLALYDLQPGFEGIAGYRLAATEKQYPDHDAFRRQWAAMGPPADPPAEKARVVFVEALAQSAEGRAPATYRASLPYAQDAGRQAGLYYLGESHAMVAFAALCRSLQMPPAGRAPVIGSIERFLAPYEKDVVKAYDSAPADERPQYAGVNVAIKLARTLDEQGRHEGALLQYLVSRFRYRLIATGGAPAAPSADLKARIAKVTIPEGTDHSIAEFFLQLAAATGSAVILDDILPAYFAVVKP